MESRLCRYCANNDGQRSELDETFDHFRKMVIVYSVAFGFTIINIGGLFFLYITEKSKLFKLSFVARVLFFTMAIAPVAIIYSRTRSFYKYFERIQTLGCSNDETNKTLANSQTQSK